MKIIIDRGRCVGHARCQSVAGELYHLDDVGYIESEGFDVPAGAESLALRGAKACPERVIKTVGNPAGQDWPPAGHAV